MKKKSTRAVKKSAPIAKKPEPVKDQPTPPPMMNYLGRRLVDTAKNLGLHSASYVVNGYRVTVAKVEG